MTRLSFRDVWERKGLCGKLLWVSLVPISFLYSAFAQFRNLLFVIGWARSVRLAKPVVSVGNLTVGGTGKTPTCLWLAQAMQDRGITVGILSRGYGRQMTRPVVLESRDEGSGGGAESAAQAAAAGDEPLMMAQLYGQTVAVAKNRGKAARDLLNKRDVDVFILDDGFQHRAVKRDVDLLLLGSDSSGWVLPAGPFREPKRNYRRADFLLVTGAADKWRSMIPQQRAERLFVGSLEAVSLLSLGSRRKEFPLTLLYRSKILTVTGIADPNGLYRVIHDWEGEIVETLEFPDHHCYSAADWQQINRLGRLVDLIITTEKDILKLVRFPFAKDKLLALRVAMTVENSDALVDAIVKQINWDRSKTQP